MKNLILGYCVGLKREDIELFCESALLSVRSPTDVVLFTNTAFHCEPGEGGGGLFLIPAESIWQGVAKDRYRIRWAAVYFATRMLGFFSKFQRRAFSLFFGGSARDSRARGTYYLHPALGRYRCYLDFLLTNAGGYSKVLISDVRDVYFQGDPFEAPGVADFTSFFEPGGVTCAEERNHRWIKAVYGSKVANEMADHGVICSGVSIGSTTGMLDYLRRMSDEISSRAVIPYSDQGIHNVLIRQGSLRASILENRDSLTLTAGIDTSGTDYRIDGDRILSPDGSAFRVVHQFDRHPDLEAAVRRQFATRRQIRTSGV